MWTYNKVQTWELMVYNQIKQHYETRKQNNQSRHRFIKWLNINAHEVIVVSYFAVSASITVNILFIKSRY